MEATETREFIARVEEAIARDEEMLVELERVAEGFAGIAVPMSDAVLDGVARLESMCAGPVGAATVLPTFGIRI
jgi:hypothetical protein